MLSSSGDPAHVLMPGVHPVAALLKRWILGTHQGSVTPAHLQSYLEALTFRFNRRNSSSRGLVFRRLIEQAVVAGPLTTAELTFGYDWSSSHGRRS
jgi:ISXO2-like transposase domain